MPGIDPNIALSVKPPQAPDILEGYTRLAALQQMGQQRQLGQVQLQQAQRQQQSEEAARQLFSEASQPGAEMPTDQAILGKLGPTTGSQVIKSLRDAEKTKLEIQNTKGEVAAKEADYAGNLGAMVRDAKYSPDAWALAVQHAQQAGYGNTVAQLNQAVQQDPSKIKPIVDAMIAQSPGQQKLANEAKTAQAAADRAAAQSKQADTSATKLDIETPGLKAKSSQEVRSELAGRLGAAANQDEYQQILNKAPFEVARDFAGKTPEQARRLGMTAEQQTQADQAAKNSSQTAAHNAVTEAQGAARNRVEQGRLGIEQQRYGFETGGGVSPQAKAIAAGEVSPQTTRMMVRSNPGLISQVKAVDPNWDEATIDNRYNVLNDFRPNGKSGQQVIALNTLIHHADLYQEVAQSLKNGTFVPGNAVYNAVASAFGSAPPTNAALVGRFLAGETGKVATGGVPAEGEINGVLKSLSTSASPDQIAQAGNKLLSIAGGRATPLMEQVKNAKVGNIIHVIGPDAQAILQKHGFDPQTMKPVAAAAKAPAVGAVQQGYKFKGGDPAKPENWEKQ